MKKYIPKKIQKFFSGDSRSVIVKKNIIGSLLIKGISIAVSLMLVPLTLGYMQSELYGIWLTLSSIVLWLNFFDIGFTYGLKNKLTEAIANDNFYRGKQLVSTAYVMMFAIFIPLAIILVLLAPLMDWCKLLNVNGSYSHDILRTIQILIVCFCCQMIVNTLIAVVAAFQKVAFSSLFTVVGQVASLLVLYILTKTVPPSLTIMASFISVVPIIVLIIFSISLYSHKFKEVVPSIKCFDYHLVKDIFSLGYKFFIIQIQVVVLYQSTNIIISNIAGPDEVTAYNIGYRYLNAAMMIFQLIMNPLWPAFTDAYTRKDYPWMNKVYKKFIRLYILVFLGITTMVIISPFVYKIWIGNKVEVPFILTTVIGIYVVLHCWDALQITLISGVGAVKLETRIVIVGLICYLPLAFGIGSYMGAVGVVLAKTIINAIYVIFFTIQINKILKNKATGIWIQ